MIHIACGKIIQFLRHNGDHKNRKNCMHAHMKHTRELRRYISMEDAIQAVKAINMQSWYFSGSASKLNLSPF
ncbi:hypothetical protein N7535_008876 [Penicillium sp. DV-2018c]|nr:hypothetical protein N7535_008876 [Penicillium sp. DV-2018c]